MRGSMAGDALGFAGRRGKAFLTPYELAAFLRVSRDTLQDWRDRGQGPAFLKLGRHTIRYPWPGVVAYLKSTASMPSPTRDESRPLPQLQAGAAGE